MITIGQVLNDTYEITDRIGSGGGGIIYKAYHKRMQKYVAIKLIKDEIKSGSNIRSEVDMLKNLKNDFLPQVIDFVEDGDDIYTVMEFIEGKNFKQLISSGKTFNETQVRKYALQLCDAVEYLHNHNPPIIHSDIKPANIMLTPKNNICLIDFNISMTADNGFAKSKGGSMDFGAPEQFKRLIKVPREIDEFHEETRFINDDDTEILLDDKNSESNVKTKNIDRAYIDVRTDIYGIGASVYYMLTSRVPVDGHLDFRGIHCSSEIIEIIAKTMNPDSSKRYKNVNKLKKALKSQISLNFVVLTVACAVACGSLCTLLMLLNPIKSDNELKFNGVTMHTIDYEYEQATTETEITLPPSNDIEMPVDNAKKTDGHYGASVIFAQTELNAARFTEDTEIKIEFELYGDLPANEPPVELVLQNYTDDPAIWAKVRPFEYDNNSATFSYNDMVFSYGNTDLSTVDSIIINDCGTEVKVTKFVVKCLK